MSDDSSSAEEDFIKFEEAVDKNFLTEALFNNDKTEKKVKSITKPPTVFPNQDQQVKSVNPFTIKVSQEFQNHVAKHLSKLMEKIIDDTEVLSDKRKLKKKPLNSCVKLLKSSKANLAPAYDLNTVPKQRRRKKCHSDNYFIKRAKQVAVTPEWVLSQKETLHWAPNTKGELEVITMNSKNRTLIS